MITLTFTTESDEADDWLVIEAWFLGARVACVEKYSTGFYKISMDGFDTPETLAEIIKSVKKIKSKLLFIFCIIIDYRKVLFFR